MTAGKPRDPYHHGDLRKALLCAGEALLQQQGPAGLSLREVARQAGVSHMAPYRHFRDKAALLQALAELGFERLHAAMRAAAAAIPHGPEQQLIAAGVAYVRLAVEHPELTQLMFAGGGHPDGDRPTGKSAFATLQDIIASGIRAGVFRRREPGELALVAWSCLHGLAMLVMTRQLDIDAGDAAAVDRLVSSVASHVLYGISR